MRASVLLFLLLAACSHNPPPKTPPSVIWTELVSAGCSAPDAAGPWYINAQLNSGPPAWLSCMSLGGSIQSCAVPCVRNGGSTDAGLLSP